MFDEGENGRVPFNWRVRFDFKITDFTDGRGFF